MRSPPTRAVAALVAGAAALVVVVGVLADAVDQRSDIREHAAAMTGGDPGRGEAMFIQYGCGGCHGLKHVRMATAAVGPPLDGIAVRALLAGRLDNNPDNMQLWIRDPQRASPGTAMPDLNVGASDARDISAFLYTRAE
jgi:cytochrome c2